MNLKGDFGYSILELQQGEHITGVKGAEDDRGIVFIEIFTNKARKSFVVYVCIETLLQRATHDDLFFDRVQRNTLVVPTSPCVIKTVS